MAVIGFVQSHPYDAFHGGDGSYLRALLGYLRRKDHEIHGFVTNASRGRRNPIYRSLDSIEEYTTWSVNKSQRVGQRTFLPTNPKDMFYCIWKNLEVLGISPTGPSNFTHENWTVDEAIWLCDALKRRHFDVVILSFAACHYASFLSKSDYRILAIPGPLPGRLLTAGNEGSFNRGYSQTVRQDLSESLLAVHCVGFNSRDDMLYGIEQFGVRNGLVIGMGFPQHSVAVEGKQPIILFVGNDTAFNKSAVDWFLDSIWPVVLQAYPDALFRIVGRVTRSFRGKTLTGVEFVGVVPELAPEYEKAQIVIAPLVEGTAGVKIKVAEAVSYGRPLITTSVGIDINDQVNFEPATIIANDPASFANAIISLLANPDLRALKRRGATKVFVEYFSDKASYQQLSDWIDS